MKKTLLAILPFAFLSGIVYAAGLSPTEEISLVPAPEGGLPKPYEHNQFKPKTSEEKAYFNYLRTTSMFPDEQICTQHLRDTLTHLRPSDVLLDIWYEKRTDLGTNEPEAVELISNEWVTPPFFAWGGYAKGGAVIGPLDRAFSIMESHLTYKVASGEIKKATYSCFVQYALQGESEIWFKGALKYGAYLKEGHKQHNTGPAKLFGFAAPGNAVTWEKRIYQYPVKVLD